MPIIPKAPSPPSPIGPAATRIPRVFELNAAEREAAATWMHQHLDESEECRPGSSGELFCIGFTQSGMGAFVEIRCIRCDEKEDITDTSDW